MEFSLNLAYLVVITVVHHLLFTIGSVIFSFNSIDIPLLFTLLTFYNFYSGGWWRMGRSTDLVVLGEVVGGVMRIAI